MRSGHMEQTRLAFMEAFWKIYCRKDISHISVQEVCNAAGYHRNTFYRYFYDVYDLLEQVEDQIINDIMANTDESLLAEDISDITQKFLDVWEKNRSYIEVFADEKKGYRFQAKMTAAHKQVCRKYFYYSEDSAIDDYLWEHHTTGTVAAMFYAFRNKDDIDLLQQLIPLLLELRDDKKYPLRLKNKTNE